MLRNKEPTSFQQKWLKRNNKVSLKRSKTKKKGRKRANEVESDEEEEENEVFAKNEELKKIIDSLVPEEQQDDHVEEAKRIMMIQGSKNEDLAKEVSRLSRENSLLEKSLIELKKRNDDEGGLSIDSLTEENKALISQNKNLKKEVQEIKSSVAEGSILKDTHVSRDESHNLDQRNRTKDGDDRIGAIGNADDGAWQQWEQYREAIRDQEDKIAVFEEENLHIKSDLSKAEERVNSLDSDLATLRLEYAQLASEKPSKGGKADQVIKQQMEQLMVENQDLKEQNKQIGSKTQPTKRLEVKLDKKDREIEKLQKEIDDLKSKKKGAKGEDAQDKSSKKQGGAHAKSEKTKDKEIGKLKSELEKLKDRIETLTITAEARKEEIKSLHQINKDQDREIKGMKGDLTSLEKVKDKSMKKAEQVKEKQSAEAKAKEEELKK